MMSRKGQNPNRVRIICFPIIYLLLSKDQVGGLAYSFVSFDFLSDTTYM